MLITLALFLEGNLLEMHIDIQTLRTKWFYECVSMQKFSALTEIMLQYLNNQGAKMWYTRAKLFD